MSNFFSSSIGKKLLMSLAGLFLIVFLVVHLSLNLLLLVNDNGESFRKAVEFTTTNPIIRILEIVLFAGFLVHIIWGVILQVQDWLARPKRYAVTNNSQTSFFSKYMIHTGVIILVFLILHLVNFYFVKLGWAPLPAGAEDKHDFYNMAVSLFSQPVYVVIYVVCIILLGFHLHHAFQSAFQTMGINHKKYSPVIYALGLIYAIVISVGFAIIPIYFLIFK